MTDNIGNRDPRNPELQRGLNLLDEIEGMLQSERYTIGIDDILNQADLRRRQQYGQPIRDRNYDIYQESYDFPGTSEMAATLTFEETIHQPGEATVVEGDRHPAFVPAEYGCELVLRIFPMDDAIQQRYGVSDATKWYEFLVFGTGEDARVVCEDPLETFHDASGIVAPARLAAMQQLAWERAANNVADDDFDF